MPAGEPLFRSFDAAAARASVRAVDLSPCVTRGASRGYGHARVTFHASGSPARVAIDAPAGLGEGAVACLGERLAAVSVPPFDGGEMTMGTGYFVP